MVMLNINRLGTKIRLLKYYKISSGLNIIKELGKTENGKTKKE